MVSVYPNPPPGQESYCYYTRTGLPGMYSPSPATTVNHTASGDPNFQGGGFAPDDQNKKVRKPYTISKSRESWTEQEHDKFLEALQLFDRDWKKIEAFVGSKTVIQIRSHAQKYFLKVQKSGANEHVPPPRPKRKAAHPYPQKAPKNGLLQPSSVEPGFVTSPDSLSVPANAIGSRVLSPWSCNNVPTFSVSHVTKDDARFTSTTVTQNCNSSSNESINGSRPNNETSENGKNKQNKQIRAVPDFARVYEFIGSIFDPNSSDHLQRLNQMDPINVETALILMKNLSANLVSPEFEGFRRLLSSYGAVSEEDKAGALLSRTSGT
ncbi:PREDICTED: protein REVEILLE 5-like isoform X1 [Ipomoea nil]|uniref:protein REVEILLE 5-like isoform X1 n=1 Tax=Ipomoea nil TaxID=35883 RepID=UPI0009009C44|nr:PREDICTED: protein REVEILLE 5-like isoform X1 [Ipomoea nil]